MTSAREALLEKLVISLHLSVPERQMLGSTCVFEEVAAVVTRLLERSGVFPPHAKQWQIGETVFEGFFHRQALRRKGEYEMAAQQPDQAHGTGRSR